MASLLPPQQAAPRRPLPLGEHDSTQPTDLMPANLPAAVQVAHIRRAMLRANDYVVSDIECACERTTLPGSTHHWYDTRAMFNHDELSAQCIDMNVQAMLYAEEAGLIERNHFEPHMVRIVGRGA